jgi:hypothetical protein
MTYHDARISGCVTIETDGAPHGSAAPVETHRAVERWRQFASRLFQRVFAAHLTDSRIAGLFLAGHLGPTEMTLVLLSLSVPRHDAKPGLPGIASRLAAPVPRPGLAKIEDCNP